MPSFLTTTRSSQHQIWNDAWKNFSTNLIQNSKFNGITILILHGVYVSARYGVRSFIDFNSICKEYNPTLIITLLDDIYNLFSRTESHASGDKNLGRPTFEQLLMARRNETLVGDLIAYQNSLTQPARHVICSVNHPIKTLLDLIIFDAKIVYLAFPISEPRRMSEKNDNSFIESINNLHNLISERNTNHLVYLSPLAIDELPLCFEAMPTIQEYEGRKKTIKTDDMLDDETKKERLTDLDSLVISFNKNSRWNLSDLWNDCELICDNTPIIPEEIEIPVSQLVDIHGIIKTDIGWRDYKLVEQADVLALFCPVPPNRDDVTRGVMGEWQEAATNSKACYVYQEADWDLNKRIEALTSDAGSMGSQPINNVSQQVDTVEELLTRCEKKLE